MPVSLSWSTTPHLHRRPVGVPHGSAQGVRPGGGLIGHSRRERRAMQQHAGNLDVWFLRTRMTEFLGDAYIFKFACRMTGKPSVACLACEMVLICMADAAAVPTDSAAPVRSARQREMCTASSAAPSPRCRDHVPRTSPGRSPCSPATAACAASTRPGACVHGGLLPRQMAGGGMWQRRRLAANVLPRPWQLCACLGACHMWQTFTWSPREASAASSE